jgi:hypothetical protein
MRTQKTMTPKAIASNQKNAQQSTGPKNVGAVADNAVKHGLLSRNLRFRNAEDEEKFHRLLADLTRDYAPIGALEEVLVEEMAICWSRSELANAWLTENFVNRGDAASSIIGALAGRSDEGKFPYFPLGTTLLQSRGLVLSVASCLCAVAPPNQTRKNPGSQTAAELWERSLSMPSW